MEKAFLMGDGIVPTEKASALNTKYLSWWFYPEHRMHTAVVDIYEKSSSCN
jgi:hypothetical protein